MPRGHRRPADAAGHRAVEIAVGGKRSRRGRAELEHTEGKVARPRRKKRGGRPVAVALGPVAADAPGLVDDPAEVEQIGARRDRHDRHADRLRLEHFAPRPAVRAELLDVFHQADHVQRGQHQRDGREGRRLVPEPLEVDHRRPVERPAAVGGGRHERETRGVRIERDLHVGLHREVVVQLDRLRQLQVALGLRHRQADLRIEPLEARHDGVGHDEARIEVMRVVPVVPVLEPDARQVGADPPRREQMRQIIRVLAGLGDRPPAQVLARHRPHVLAVAVPAALADVDAAAQTLERRVVDRVVAHPLHVAQIGPHRPAHLLRARLRDHRGQEALDEHGERHAEEAGADRQRADRSHGLPRTVRPRARPATSSSSCRRSATCRCPSRCP